MEIKWHDMTRGTVKTERWTRISSSKAMEMLRRKAPDRAADLQCELNRGREVVMDGYTLRDETVKKAEFMQGLDDDDYNTATFLKHADERMALLAKLSRLLDAKQEFTS